MAYKNIRPVRFPYAFRSDRSATGVVDGELASVSCAAAMRLCRIVHSLVDGKSSSKGVDGTSNRRELAQKNNYRSLYWVNGHCGASNH